VTDRETNQFEEQLRRSRPAKPPEEMWSRLLAAKQPKKARSAVPLPALAALGWRRVLQLFVPAAGLALLTVLLWPGLLRHGSVKSPASGPQSQASSGTPALKADDVVIAEDLVSSFDTLAKLPSGEPVRFRCRQWLDQVTLRDKSRGVVLQEQTPRIEVIAVGFETY
jgi:hypothetical protein